MFSGVCGHSKFTIRKTQWDFFVELQPKDTEEWIVSGDFNDVLDTCEKSGGNPIPYYECAYFNDMIQDCALIYIAFKGRKYTWCNMQEGRNRI